MAVVKAKQPKSPPPSLIHLTHTRTPPFFPSKSHHSCWSCSSPSPPPRSAAHTLFPFPSRNHLTPAPKDKDASSSALMARFLSNVQSRDPAPAASAGSTLPPQQPACSPAVCARVLLRTNIVAVADSSGSSADITTKILEAGPVLERYPSTTVTRLKP